MKSLSLALLILASDPIPADEPLFTSEQTAVAYMCGFIEGRSSIIMDECRPFKNMADDLSNKERPKREGGL